MNPNCEIFHKVNGKRYAEMDCWPRKTNVAENEQRQKKIVSETGNNNERKRRKSIDAKWNEGKRARTKLTEKNDPRR